MASRSDDEIDGEGDGALVGEMDARSSTLRLNVAPVHVFALGEIDVSGRPGHALGSDRRGRRYLWALTSVGVLVVSVVLVLLEEDVEARQRRSHSRAPPSGVEGRASESLERLELGPARAPLAEPESSNDAVSESTADPSEDAERESDSGTAPVSKAARDPESRADVERPETRAASEAGIEKRTRRAPRRTRRRNPFAGLPAPPDTEEMPASGDSAAKSSR